MIIEIEEKDFRKLQDGLGEIRALAFRARMSGAEQSRNCLGDIIIQVNALTGLLDRGTLVIEETVGAPR